MTDHQIKSHIPFSQVTKIWRYLSFKDKNGKDKRLTYEHAGILAYLAECPQFYKSARVIQDELGICNKKFQSLRDELATPTIEMGVPLISLSKFEDRHGNNRIEIEVYPYQEEMGNYYKKLYQGENSEEYRKRWVAQWRIKNNSKCRSLAYGGVGALPTGVQAGDLHKENKEKDTKEKKKSRNSVAPSLPASRLSSLLWEKIKENDPQAKQPNLEKWAIEFDKMIRLDKRSAEDIETLIIFSQEHEFWSTNILSPAKLRKQATRLTLLMKKEGSKDPSKDEQADIDAKIKEIRQRFDPLVEPGSWRIRDNCVEIDINDRWHIIGYREHGFMEQVECAFRKGGHL